MGQTASAGGGGSNTHTPQALYPDLSCPEGLEELLSAPPPDLGAQRRHGWNPKDCSENIELSRLCVRHALGDTRLGHVSALPLPPAAKRHLLYR